MTCRRCQAGFTLAEWLLASLLGSLVLAAALAWLQASLQMQLSQRAPAELADTGQWLYRRWWLSALQAGQGGVHPLGLDDARLAAWRPADASGSGIPASDQFMLVRQLDAAARDCEGTSVAAGDVLVERWLVRADSSATGLVLACDGGSCNASGCQRLGDSGMAVQGEIDSLQVLYGLAPESGQTLRYVDATVLRSISPPPRVLALRAGLLAHSRERLPGGRIWPVPVDWLGVVLPAQPTGRAHAAWQWTLELPNG